MTEGYEPEDPDKPRYPPGTTPPYEPGYQERGDEGAADGNPDHGYPDEPGPDGAEDDRPDHQ